MPTDVFPAACRSLLWTVLVCTAGLADYRGPTLKSEPREKYEAYIRETEARIQREVQSPAYLWAAQSPLRWARVRRGEVVVETWNDKGDLHIGGAIIHDWIGALFISGVELDQVVSFLQDYGVHKNYYRPEVIESRLLSHHGNESKVYYRLVKKKVLTVVLDTDQTAFYYPLSKTRLYTSSYATRIAEVKDAGKPSERVLPPGKDHGFLWRLNTYWRLEEKDGGVYVECQTISLTREVLLGLGWLINPIIRSLPGESLAHLLASTRAAVESRRRQHSRRASPSSLTRRIIANPERATRCPGRHRNHAPRLSCGKVAFFTTATSGAEPEGSGPHRHSSAGTALPILAARHNVPRSIR